MVSTRPASGQPHSLPPACARGTATPAGGLRRSAAPPTRATPKRRGPAARGASRGTRSGTPAAAAVPAPALTRVEAPSSLWRRCPEPRRPPRRAGTQPRAGLRGDPRGILPTSPRAPRPATRRAEGHRGEAGGREPALTIRAPFGGRNGREAAPPRPGAEVEAGGTRTRRRERARSRSAWDMVPREPG